MATQIQASFTTNHTDMVHDSQLDYYGRRLATCSSDRTIKVFDVGEDLQQQTGEIIAHEGPVWQIGWAHPQFGVLLASCGYDRRVNIHKEVQLGTWVKIYTYEGHGASVNGIAWAPHEFGLQLAACSSDGSISVHSHREEDQSWHVSRFPDCTIGCNAISWAPAAHIGGTQPDNYNTGSAEYVKRLAVASSDGRVRLHKAVTNGSASGPGSGESWTREADLVGEEGAAFPHREWVRDVAWSPSSGVGANTLASCSDDGVVAVWTQTSPGGAWVVQVLPRFESPCWRVSWSVTGHLLAVSCADNAVTLWKQAMDGQFVLISAVPDATTTQTQTQG